MKLNLGCSDRALPGFIGVDIVPPADQIADLRDRWPWPDSSVEVVIAHDILEHLPDKRHSLNELWRVLQSRGYADIIVPTIRGVGAVCDPTHCSWWSAGDFEYYEKGNFARERFRPSYGIQADYKIKGDPKQTMYLNRFGEEVWKVQIVLEAIK